MKFRCAHCKKSVDRPAGHVNRARKSGLRLFCGRRCSGLARRQHKTKAQRKEEKRLYDLDYRAKNLEMLKAKKQAYHLRTYDPAKAAVERKKRMPKHIEYCRQPEYKRWKKDYDRKYRSGKMYGPFADAFMTLMDLTQEIKSRSTRYENDYQNGKLNKTQRRRRAGSQEPERSRPRHRERRAGHPATHG